MIEMPLTIIAIVILVLGSIASLKSPKLGLYSAVLSIIIAFLACIFPQYGVFILAIGLINLASLNAINSKIKGIDYGLVGFMTIITLYIFNTNDLSLLLASLVMVSAPTYILVMIREGGMNTKVGIKYITFMVLATILFLMGAIILATGITSLYILGYVMLVIGLALEVGIAPLHEWVPDVFASADPIPISIIASMAKVVPFVAAFRILYSTSMELTAVVTIFTAVLAAVSMFIGNIGALTSKEHARVLGYSTVANMGYVLSCVVIITNPEFIVLALAGGLLLLFSNAAGKIGFLNAIKGDGAYKPLMFLLAFSFLGVPPLLGFWGKLFIVIGLAKVGYIWLAVIVILNSAISIPYYLRLAKELGGDWNVNLTNVISVAVVLIILIVISPNWFMTGVETIVPWIGLGIGG